MSSFFSFIHVSRFLSAVILFLCGFLYIGGVDEVQAQSAVQQVRAQEYCARSSYEGCEDYRYEKSTAVDQILATYKKTLDKKPAAFALREATNYDDRFQMMQQLDAESGMSVFVTYIRDYFADWIEEYTYIVETIHIPISYIRDANGFVDTMELRSIIVRKLIDEGFDKFKSKPLSVGANNLLTADDTMQYSLSTNIYANDALDQYISGLALSSDMEELKIPADTRTNRSDISLFKSTQDLNALGYEVSSHRSRFNYDEAYRRTNISTAFSKIGHIRVLNPGQKFSFLDESQYDPYAQSIYQFGKVIFLDEEVDDYGGGLCGASTAIYQGIVTNKSLARPALRNHSKWYTSLYTATIDGQKISTPGIDSTIYSSSLDLVLENTASYPIILVMNYDGTYQSEEEVFTLGRPGDKGNVTYISQRPYATSLMKDGVSKKITGTCYTWNINGKHKESCYKEVH